MKINHEETKNTKEGAAKQYNAEFTAEAQRTLRPRREEEEERAFWQSLRVPSALSAPLR